VHVVFPGSSRGVQLLIARSLCGARRPRLAVGADAIDGVRAALESRLAELEKSAQCGRLAQQHCAFALVGAQPGRQLQLGARLR